MATWTSTAQNVVEDLHAVGEAIARSPDRISSWIKTSHPSSKSDNQSKSPHNYLKLRGFLNVLYSYSNALNGFVSSDTADFATG